MQISLLYARLWHGLLYVVLCSSLGLYILLVTLRCYIRQSLFMFENVCNIELK